MIPGGLTLLDLRRGGYLTEREGNLHSLSRQVKRGSETAFESRTW